MIEGSRWTRLPYKRNSSPNAWERTFAFGGITGAVVDESVIVSNNAGKPKRVTLVRRFIQGGGLCDTVIGKGSVSLQTCEPIPELTISTSVGSKLVAEMDEVTFLTDKTQGSRRGFVMMTAGAFSWQSADSMLARWRSTGSSQELLERLERIAWCPENVALFGEESERFLRMLHNIHDMGTDGAFSGTGLNSDPGERCCMSSIRMLTAISHSRRPERGRVLG